MLQPFKILTVILFCVMLPSSIALAQSVPSIPAVQYQINKASNSYTLPDLKWIIKIENQTLTIEDIEAGRLKDATLIDLKDNPTFHFDSHNDYWFNIQLHSKAIDDHFGLVIDHTGDCWPWEFSFYNIEAYKMLGNGIVTTAYSGTSRSASERDFSKTLTRSIIKTSINESTPTSMWIKLSMAEQCNLKIDLSLEQLDKLYESRILTSNISFHLVTYGGIIALFFFVLLLFFWFRESVYIWFLLFSLCFILGRIFTDFKDETFLAFFPNNPRFFVILLTLLDGCRFLAMLQFGRVYINTKEKYPRIHSILGLILIGFATPIILGPLFRTFPFEYDYIYFSFRAILFLILLSSITAILIYFIFSKDKLARIYGIGVLLPFGAIFVGLVILQTTNTESEIITLLISTGTLITMTLALAYRFRFVMQEKELALVDKLSAEQENVDQLQKINEASNKFVPQTFLNFLGKKNILEARLGDFVEKQVTVLFSDIRDYTSLSEKMTPEETFRFVTAFNRRMGPIINQHQGFINQYLGDGIMAIFPKDVGETLRGAIAMQHTLVDYNQQRQQKNKRPIRMGIGLHTGSLIMGIIGDEERLDAATISDTVNVSARIESLSKHFGANILLSDACYKEVKNKADFHVRFMGQIIVKGKDKPLGIYECFDGDLPPQFNLKQQTLATFEKGVKAYYGKDFNHALQIFKDIVALNNNDTAAKLFLEKAENCINQSVEKDWTGIEKMIKK